MGCYILPSDLETLTYIDKAWSACPTGAHPILARDLNINLRAPRTEQEKTIAEQMNSMKLVDMSRHFCQRSRKRLRGKWVWQMGRTGRWISSQCNYFLGRETNRRRLWRISVRMPCYYFDHCALVSVIYAEGGEELKRYQWRAQQFPLSLPHGPHKLLDAEYQELLRDVVWPPIREFPANKWITTTTWKLIDHHLMLRRKGMVSQTASRGLGQQIKAVLTADHQLPHRTSKDALRWGNLLRRGAT